MIQNPEPVLLKGTDTDSYIKINKGIKLSHSQKASFGKSKKIYMEGKKLQPVL